MNAYDRLPGAAAEIFGAEATAERAYDLLTVDVPAASWTAALVVARDQLACGYFDWLSAVDEPGTGFQVCAHVAALGGGTVRRLLIRTTVPHDAAVLPTAVGIYPGAGWHERETHEMFGVEFTDHPHLVHLLLPENFEGHPLRKDFVLAARVAKAWPGAKEPGEPAAGAAHGGPKRRQMLPPGVPDPNEWGPLKGQLPPVAARSARAAGATGAAGERPARRASREAPERPATRRTEGAAPEENTSPAPAAPARRTRSVSEGSASQQAARAATPSPTEPAPGQVTEPAPGHVTEAAPGPDKEAGRRAGSRGGTAGPAAAPSSDAPWHHPRPASPPAPHSSDPAPSEKPAEGPADPESDRPGGDA